MGQLSGRLAQLHNETCVEEPLHCGTAVGDVLHTCTLTPVLRGHYTVGQLSGRLAQLHNETCAERPTLHCRTPVSDVLHRYIETYVC